MAGLSLFCLKGGVIVEVNTTQKDMGAWQEQRIMYYTRLSRVPYNSTSSS